MILSFLLPGGKNGTHLRLGEDESVLGIQQVSSQISCPPRDPHPRDPHASAMLGTRKLPGGGPRDQGVPPPQCALNVQRQNQGVGPTGERPSQKERARVFVMMPEPHSED